MENFKFLSELVSGSYSEDTKGRLQRAAEAMFDPGKRDPSFEDELGLKNLPNVQGWAARMRLIRSREALREAWRLVSAEPLSDWARATLLSNEIKAFSANFWPIWSRPNCAPRETSELRRALFSAFKAKDGKVPASPRQLYALMVVLGNEITEV